MINEYVARTVFNRKVYHSIAIDDHYKFRHKDMNDQLILELCCYLDEIEAPHESIKRPYTYYAFDINHKKKWFRLVLA